MVPVKESPSKGECLKTMVPVKESSSTGTFLCRIPEKGGSCKGKFQQRRVPEKDGSCKGKFQQRRVPEKDCISFTGTFPYRNHSFQVSISPTIPGQQPFSPLIIWWLLQSNSVAQSRKKRNMH